MVLRSRSVNPLAVAGFGGAIIAILIGTAMNPPGGDSGPQFIWSSDSDSVSVAEPMSVNCPDIAGRLPALPARVQAKVAVQLANLDRQIVDAEVGVARYPEQAVDHLTKINGQRHVVIERIIRHITKSGSVEPDGLSDLAVCSLQRNTEALDAIEAVGEAPSTVDSIPSAGEGGAAEPSKPPKKAGRAEDGETKPEAGVPSSDPVDASAGGPGSGGGSDGGGGSGVGDGSGAGSGGSDSGGSGGEGSGDGAAPSGPGEPAGNGGDAPVGPGSPVGSGSGGGSSATPTVSCPSVKDRLPAVPAAAAAEVDRNLAELVQQISEADTRLAELAARPVGDPNFVQNTILGPLRDRRIATLDRIAIAIGRVTTAPTNLAQLAPCTLKS